MHNNELWEAIEKKAYEIFAAEVSGEQNADGAIFAYRISEPGHKSDVFFLRAQVNDEQLVSLGFDPKNCTVEYLFCANMPQQTLRLATRTCMHPGTDEVGESNGRTMPLYAVLCGPEGVVEKTFQVEKKGEYLVVVSDDGFDGKKVRADLVGSFVDQYFGFSDAALSRNSMEEARLLWNAGVNRQIEELGNAMARKRAMLVAKQ